MGFRETRDALIKALRDGRFDFEPRASIEAKNLLYTGDVSPEFVAGLLLRCRGDRHTTAAHHLKPGVVVDIFTVPHDGRRWYIKTFFLRRGDVVAVFISVHP